MTTKKSLTKIERRLGITSVAPEKTASTTAVGPKEFVERADLLNAKDELYPAVMEALVELCSGKYEEAVLTGAIGCGKTTLGIFATAYLLFRLSVMVNPQKEYALSTDSPIVIVFQNLNSALARNVDFLEFKQLIDRAPYFCKQFRYTKRTDSELRFPKGIVVRAFCGLSTAALGQNLIGGVIDEVNYMSRVARSQRSADGGTHDQAVELYHAISRRRKSRFMRDGKVAGLLCLVSSKRYPGEFTEQKIAEAKKQLAETESTNIFVYDKRPWEIRPEGTFSGKWFEVFIGDLARKPFVLEGAGIVAAQDRSLVMWIPEDYRQDFEGDIHAALRDVAGIATLAIQPFLTNREAVAACFGKTQSILTRDSVVWPGSQLSVYPDKFGNGHLIRWAHLDLSVTGDATGLVIGCVPKFVQIDRGGTPETMPMIRIDCALQVRPPKGGEILLEKIRALLYLLKDEGLNICYVSADSFQSRDMLQQLKQRGFTTGQQSLDKYPHAYEVLKEAIYDGRLAIPDHEILHRELIRLERNPETGKVDHPPGGSKDLADALAGVVFGLSRRPDIWDQHEIDPYESAPSFVQYLRESAARE